VETPWNNSNLDIFCLNDESPIDVKVSQVYVVCCVIINQYVMLYSDKLKKKSCFISQEQWNNYIKKTCGCRPWTHCRKIKEELNNNVESPL
jgi:hypothetical protein